MFDYTFLQVILYQAVIDVLRERPFLDNKKYTVD